MAVKICAITPDSGAKERFPFFKKISGNFSRACIIEQEGTSIMAHPAKRLKTNVEGNFFVDSTCINCDTCRQLAPATFVEDSDYSAVFHQPETAQEEFAAYQALLACPVGSIGTVKKDPQSVVQAQASFPLQIEDGVYYVGFNSEKSFGANSYLIQHPQGNWLVDSPRFHKHLVKAFEEKGGLRYIFLSHEDDVADAARYARAFGTTRIIHRDDASAMPDAELVIDGEEPVQVGTDFLCIPVPGHTKGSMALLYHNRFLFSGDHLWWERERRQLGTPERLVWDDGELEQSIRKLRHHSFEWVLPGHGERIHLPSCDMTKALDHLLQHRWDVQRAHR
jgi:glyoxylase-like metal-dependent hydrolase (beta-lactamase superfamily II)/ferredoxin